MKFFLRELQSTIRRNHKAVLTSYLDRTFGNREDEHIKLFTNALYGNIGAEEIIEDFQFDEEPPTLKQILRSVLEKKYNEISYSWDIYYSTNPWMSPLSPYTHYSTPINHAIKAIASIPNAIFMPIVDLVFLAYHLLAMIIHAAIDTANLLYSGIICVMTGRSFAPEANKLIDNMSYYSFSMVTDLLDIFVKLLTPFVAIPTMATRGLATGVEYLSPGTCAELSHTL